VNQLILVQSAGAVDQGGSALGQLCCSSASGPLPCTVRSDAVHLCATMDVSKKSGPDKERRNRSIALLISFRARRIEGPLEVEGEYGARSPRTRRGLKVTVEVDRRRSDQLDDRDAARTARRRPQSVRWRWFGRGGGLCLGNRALAGRMGRPPDERCSRTIRTRTPGQAVTAKA